MTADASLLLDGADGSACPSIVRTLSRFGSDAIAFAIRFGTRVVPLRPGQRYDEASPALRRLGVDVDAWPAPPAGLFVVEERAVFLRSRSAMTVAHEFGHALDCALGGGVYRSSMDPQLRGLFAAATQFVTPYAATGTDEYFAVMWNRTIYQPAKRTFDAADSALLQFGAMAILPIRGESLGLLAGRPLRNR